MTRILCVAIILVATTITPASAQGDQPPLRTVVEGDDTSPVFDLGDEVDDLYRLEIEGTLDRTVDPDGEADAYQGFLDWSVATVTGWFGDNNEDRPAPVFIWDGQTCERSDPTPGSNRSVAYDLIGAGFQSVSVGVGNFRSRCAEGPDRIEPYDTYPEPTFDYTLRTLEPRPTPNTFELNYNAEPICNSDLAEVTLDQDLAWFQYYDPFLDDNNPADRRRSGFWIDVSDVDLSRFGFKIYTNTILRAWVTDEQGNTLYYQHRDPDDPTIPSDGFEGNGPAMPIGYLSDYTGDRIYVWFGIIDPDEGNPGCVVDWQSAWAVRESFAGLLLFYGSAEIGEPVVNMTGDGGREAIVSVPVLSSAQLGGIEYQLLNANSIVVRTDTVRAWDNVSVANRWRTDVGYTLTTSFADLPDGIYTITATPLLAGLYSNVGHRRDDLATSTTVQVVGVEDGTPTPPTLSLRAYPNPLVDRGTVEFATPSATSGRIALYDGLGRQIVVFHDGSILAGSHRIDLDISGLAPGVYFLRFTTPEGNKAVPVTVLR